MIQVNVGAVNDAPTLSTPVPDQVSPEDTLWTFQIPAGTFTDVDSALVYGDAR